MIGYNEIQQIQQQYGIKSVKELLALDPKNDPFYSGSKGDCQKAEWFTSLWHQFNFVSGVHLRRMHYRIVSQEIPVTMPTGEPYQNTQKCWGYLCESGKHARYLGLVSVDAFEDHRNPEPHITEKTESEDLMPWVSEMERLATALPDLPQLPFVNCIYGETAQPYHLEIWVEKSTMNDVLLPICERYQANLVTAAGEFSITAVNHLMQRIQASGKPGRVLYISDFDPAGVTMPKSVSRKIEWFHRSSYPGLEVSLHPVALTLAQCQRYSLPRTPIKESEARRDKFEATYGDGATELDALEALYPGELEQIISSELDQFFDHGLQERCMATRHAYSERLSQAKRRVDQVFQERLDRLSEEHQELVDRIAPELRRLATAFDQFRDEYLQTLEAALNEVEKPELPDSVTGQGWGIPLFSSKRDYLVQIQAYKKFVGGQL